MERGLHRQIPVIGSPQVSFPVAAAKTLLSCCLGPGGDSNITGISVAFVNRLFVRHYADRWFRRNAATPSFRSLASLA